MSFDHILVIGFGGPRKPEELKPFLARLSQELPIPQARLEEVLRHYQAVGGSSPYHSCVSRFVRELEARLRTLGIRVPLFLGMRNWHPFLEEVVGEIKKRGLKKGIGVVLAPHRSEASFDRYVRSVAQVKARLSAETVETHYLASWHSHPLFIQAQASQVRKALDPLSRTDQERIDLLFCAHSIPRSMAERAKYAEAFTESSRLVARELGSFKWSIAYQSRSGNPREPWLGPDVGAVMEGIRANGSRYVLVVPIGFLCDNVEVLYDLDIEARDMAGRVGLAYLRAQTVMEHPSFVKMMAALIKIGTDTYFSCKEEHKAMTRQEK